MSAEGAAAAQMPRYQSHKRVWALKIAGVDGHRITFADPGFAPIECPAPMFARGKPVPGDYLVEYEGDGYRSFSPGRAFEDGYRRCDGMTFGDALDALKAGKRVARAGWNGKGMWLAMTPGNPSLPAERFWSPPRGVCRSKWRICARAALPHDEDRDGGDPDRLAGEPERHAGRRLERGRERTGEDVVTRTESDILYGRMPWFWRVILKRCPTAWLQWELWCRPGVTGDMIGPNSSKSFNVSGPCSVTLNRD